MSKVFDTPDYALLADEKLVGAINQVINHLSLDAMPAAGGILSPTTLGLADVINQLKQPIRRITITQRQLPYAQIQSVYLIIANAIAKKISKEAGDPQVLMLAKRITTDLFTIAQPQFIHNQLAGVSTESMSWANKIYTLALKEWQTPSPGHDKGVAAGAEYVTQAPSAGAGYAASPSAGEAGPRDPSAVPAAMAVLPMPHHHQHHHQLGAAHGAVRGRGVALNMGDLMRAILLPPHRHQHQPAAVPHAAPKDAKRARGAAPAINQEEIKLAVRQLVDAAPLSNGISAKALRYGCVNEHFQRYKHNFRAGRPNEFKFTTEDQFKKFGEAINHLLQALVPTISLLIQAGEVSQSSLNPCFDNMFDLIRQALDGKQELYVLDDDTAQPMDHEQIALHLTVGFLRGALPTLVAQVAKHNREDNPDHTIAHGLAFRGGRPVEVKIKGHDRRQDPTPIKIDPLLAIEQWRKKVATGLAAVEQVSASEVEASSSGSVDGVVEWRVGGVGAGGIDGGGGSSAVDEDPAGDSSSSYAQDSGATSDGSSSSSFYSAASSSSSSSSSSTSSSQQVNVHYLEGESPSHGSSPSLVLPPPPSYYAQPTSAQPAQSYYAPPPVQAYQAQSSAPAYPTYPAYQAQPSSSPAISGYRGGLLMNAIQGGSSLAAPAAPLPPSQQLAQPVQAFQVQQPPAQSYQPYPAQPSYAYQSHAVQPHPAQQAPAGQGRSAATQPIIGGAQGDLTAEQAMQVGELVQKFQGRGLR